MRIFLQTFGCRANHYDTEQVRGMVEGAGHSVVSTPADADVAVFNSCAVTAHAVTDLRKAVRHTNRLRPDVRTVIMGCAAGTPSGNDVEPLSQLPGVIGVVSGADMASLAGVLGLDVEAHATRRQSSTRALLRIQDGCDEHCTFCATRLARGAARSRPLDELVAEAAALAEHHPEIVLTGIHVGAYGADTNLSLGELLETLVTRVGGVRFRLSSLEATEVDDRLFDLLTGGDGRVCPYLHAPLQSGSDRLLRRMGRHWYTAESYARGVERLVAARPVFGLGADVMTGFPGETTDDHARTMALVERLPFTYLHVFPFSLRPGTPAVHLAGHVPERVADERAAELRAVGRRKAAAYRLGRAGGRADVVVIKGGPLAREGMSEDYLTVFLDSPRLERGARFSATLALDDGKLVARRN